MERGKRQALSSFFGGAGFYIALALCVMVTGVAGYLLLFGGQEDEEINANAAADNVVQQTEQTPPTQTIPIDRPAVESDPPESAAPVSKPVTVITPEVQPDPEKVPAEEPNLIVSPVQGETVSVFSADSLQYSETLDDWRIHDGIDISAPAGTAVVAACSGTVLSVTDDSRLGTTVVLSHGDGCETTYASLGEEVEVAPGDRISAGQQIGVVGNSALTESALGAHLHFSVVQDGRSVDPTEYLAQ